MKLGLFIGRFALDWMGFPCQTHVFFSEVRGEFEFLVQTRMAVSPVRHAVVAFNARCGKPLDVDMATSLNATTRYRGRSLLTVSQVRALLVSLDEALADPSAATRPKRLKGPPVPRGDNDGFSSGYSVYSVTP